MPTERGNVALAVVIALVAVVIALIALVVSTRRPALSPAETESAAQPSQPEGWLPDAEDRRREAIERHLRGLDVAMAEIGYRFGELHFAGQDRNWDYAQYQAEKIELALRLAIERRPMRAASSQPFLNVTMPAVHRAVASRDSKQFAAAMEQLKTGCMKCHADEQVPHFIVEFPRQRNAPLGSGR